MSLSICECCSKLKDTDLEDGAYSEDGKSYLCERCSYG